MVHHRMKLISLVLCFSASAPSFARSRSVAKPLDVEAMMNKYSDVIREGLGGERDASEGIVVLKPEDYAPIPEPRAQKRNTPKEVMNSEIAPKTPAPKSPADSLTNVLGEVQSALDEIDLLPASVSRRETKTSWEQDLIHLDRAYSEREVQTKQQIATPATELDGEIYFVRHGDKISFAKDEGAPVLRPKRRINVASLKRSLFSDTIGGGTGRTGRANQASLPQPAQPTRAPAAAVDASLAAPSNKPNVRYPFITDLAEEAVHRPALIEDAK